MEKATNYRSTHNTNDFVLNWIQFSKELIQGAPHATADNNDLQETPPPLHMESSSLDYQDWNPQDWTQATALLSEVRQCLELLPAQQQQQHAEYGPSVSTILELAFGVLDRQCVELEKLQDTERLERLRQWEPGLIHLLLMEWRNYCMSFNKKTTVSSTNSKSVIRGRGSNAKHNNKLSTKLSPQSIFNRVQNYHHVGLRCTVQDGRSSTATPYNIIFHALVQGKDDQSGRKALVGEELFEQMLSKAQLNPDSHPHPDELTVRNMVELWASKGRLQDRPPPHERALAHLRQLQRWWKEAENQADNSTGLVHRESMMKPTLSLYCAIMEAYSRYISSPSVAFDHIEALYREMKESDHFEQHEWTPVIYTRICHALANCDSPSAPDAARRVLNQMVESIVLPQLYQSSTDDNNKTAGHQRVSTFKTDTSRPGHPPLQHAFSAVITAYGRAERADDAQELFDTMVRLSQQQQQVQGRKSASISDLAPDLICWNSLIWAHARVGNSRQVESLVVRMVEESLGDEIDQNTWNGLIVSLAESSDPKTASRQIALIMERLQTRENRNDDGGVKRLPISMYKTLMSCYARFKSDEGASKAQELFDWLQEHEDPKLHPTSETYLSLIFAYKYAGNAQKSETALRELCDLVKQQQEHKGGEERMSKLFTLEPVYFDVAMQAWTQIKGHLYEKPLTIAKNVQRIFDWMKEVDVLPNLVNYNTLLWAWARASSFSAAHRFFVNNGEETRELVVEHLFQQMQEQSDHSLQPDTRTYHAVLYGLFQSPYLDAMSRAEEFFDNTIGVEYKNFKMYDIYMEGWSKVGRPDKVEAVFHEMLEKNKQERERFKQQQTEHDDGKLDRKLSSHRHQGHPEHPPFRLYVTRLKAWAHAGNPEMTTRVLHDMIEGYQNGWLNHPPSIESFHAVLHAWLQADRPNSAPTAEAGLQQLLQEGQEAVDAIVPLPDSRCFLTVISAYAKSKLRNRGEKAWILLQKLKELEAEQRTKETPVPAFNKDSVRDSYQVPSSAKRQLQADLQIYTEVTVALLQSMAQERALGHNKSSSHCPEERVKQILGELRAKPKEFWLVPRTNMLMRKIHDVLIETDRFHNLRSHWPDVESTWTRAKFESPGQHHQR